MESPVPKRSKSTSKAVFFERGDTTPGGNSREYAKRKSELAMSYLVKLGHVSVTRDELDQLDFPLSYSPPPHTKPYVMDADFLSDDEETKAARLRRQRRSTVRFMADGRKPSMFHVAAAIEERRRSRRKSRFMPRFVAKPPPTVDIEDSKLHKTRLSESELAESAQRLTTIRRPRTEQQRFRTLHDNIDMDEVELARSADRLSVSRRPKTSETKFKTIHDRVRLDRDTIERSADRLSKSYAKKVASSLERAKSRSAEVSQHIL
jgi:hypothetical protein